MEHPIQIWENPDIDSALREVVRALNVEENVLIRYFWKALLSNIGSSYSEQ